MPATTSSDERADIAPTIDSLCQQFGLDKTHVRQITILPTAITFECYAVGEDGTFRWLADDVIVETHTFKVTT